eukprot:913623-Amphidinium_carterae.1
MRAAVNAQDSSALDTGVKCGVAFHNQSLVTSCALKTSIGSVGCCAQRHQDSLSRVTHPHVLRGCGQWAGKAWSNDLETLQTNIRKDARATKMHNGFLNALVRTLFSVRLLNYTTVYNIPNNIALKLMQNNWKQEHPKEDSAAEQLRLSKF